MSTKRTVPTHPSSWTVATTVKVRGRVLTPGMVVTIKGERGRFRFRQHVVTEAGREWLDVFGPDGSFRSFHLARVRNVPRNQPSAASKAAAIREAVAA